MKKPWKRISALLLMSILLITNNRILSTAKAQDDTVDVQYVLSSSNPQENSAFFKDEIDMFRVRVLPLLEEKPEYATEIFFEQVLLLYDKVGLPFKWQYTDFYAFVTEWENQGVSWPKNEFIIQGFPSDDEITEEEAISIAQKTVLFFSRISNEELAMYWPCTSYYKISPQNNFSWEINFVLETPGEETPYYTKYSVELDAVTGTIYQYFDFRSNG